MSNCIDKLLCDNSSCDILITDINGNLIDTRFLTPNQTIYLSIPEREGYVFNNFTFQPFDGEPETVNATLQSDGRYSTNAQCGGVYIANYDVLVYKVYVIPSPDDGYHGKTNGTGEYAYGTTITISAIAYQGYHFTGWTINNQPLSDDSVYDYLVKGDVYIVGHFEGDRYSVVTKPNDPTLGQACCSGIYEYGQQITITATPFEGSTFVGWDSGLTQDTETVTVNRNVIYVANFIKNRYNVKINVYCEDETNEDNSVNTEASDISSEYSENARGIAGSGNTRAMAPNPNDISEKPKCGFVLGGGTYEYGTVVTISAFAEEGYTFVSFSDGVGEPITESQYSFTITGDIEFDATFSVKMCTLSLNVMPENAGYIQLNANDGVYNGGTYPYGTEITVKTVAIGNNEFVEWSDGDDSRVKTFVMDTDISETALFAIKPFRYTLRVNFDSSMGNVRIYKGVSDVTLTYQGRGYVYATVDEGTVLTAVVTPKNGYRISGWDNDMTDKRNIREFSMWWEIERTVYFEEIPTYTLCIEENPLFNYDEGYVNVSYGDVFYTIHDRYDNSCFNIPEWEEVSVEFVPKTQSEDEARWSVSGLGSMEYSQDGNRITIIVTENGSLSPVPTPTRAVIGVKNQPSDLLEGQVEFTITHDGGQVNTLTPNDDTLYTEPIDIETGNSGYTVSVNEPDIPGYHFTGIFNTNGGDSYGNTTLRGDTLNGDVVYTCVYEKDGCQAEIGFDIQNVSSLSMGGSVIRENGVFNVNPNNTFTVSADSGYTLTDVIDVTNGSSNGNGNFSYVPFPICDEHGIGYYYKSVPLSQIPEGEEITTIYDRKYLPSQYSPSYVKLVGEGFRWIYGKKESVDISTNHYYDPSTRSISNGGFYNITYYNGDSLWQILNSPSKESPSIIMDESTGSFFVKVGKNLTYSAECGNKYQVCLTQGNYTIPNLMWYPVFAVPSNVPQHEILVDRHSYPNYTYFTYHNKPETALANGYSYALAVINGNYKPLKLTDIR